MNKNFRTIPRQSPLEQHVNLKFSEFENNKKNKKKKICADAARNKCLKMVANDLLDPWRYP